MATPTSETSRASHLRRRGVRIPRGLSLSPPEDHRCEVCGTDTPGGRGGWHIDHDHDTKAIRGWLCANCNQALGKLKDSPAVLAGALRYLARHGKALPTEELAPLLNP